MDSFVSHPPAKSHRPNQSQVSPLDVGDRLYLYNLHINRNPVIKLELYNKRENDEKRRDYFSSKLSNTYVTNCTMVSGLHMTFAIIASINELVLALIM